MEVEGKIQGYKHTTVDFLEYHNDSFQGHMCNVMYLANTIHFESNIWTHFKHVNLKVNINAHWFCLMEKYLHLVKL